MNDYNYTDFLIKKTVQPHSLRNLHGAVNQNQNLILHLNKKAAQIRQEGEEGQMSTMQIVESKKLQVEMLPDTDRYVKQITHPKKINWREQISDTDSNKINMLMNQDKYTDDVVVVSEGSKITRNNFTAYQKQLDKLKKQKAIWTIENKLKFVMADKLKFQQLKNLHKEYVTEKVKRNFWEQRFQKEESPVSESENNFTQLDTSTANKIARSTAEYFKTLRDKSRETVGLNAFNSQHINAKEVLSYEGSPTNSQLSTCRVTFFDQIDKIQKQQKGSKREITNQNIQGINMPFHQNQAKQHFIEAEHNNLQSKIHSNNTTQHTFLRQEKEGQIGLTYIGGPANMSNLERGSNINQSQQNIKKQDSLHAHFEIDFNKENKNFESSKELQNKNNEQLPQSNRQSYNKIDSKLSFGYHENERGPPTMININPFNSEIFISGQEYETEKECKDLNPGELYEQLRQINSENEKRLIDKISKKNKFQLVDLFPNSVKNFKFVRKFNLKISFVLFKKAKPYKYVPFDEIQLSDFDKDIYIQKKIDKERAKRKSVDLAAISASNRLSVEGQQQKQNKARCQTEKSSPTKAKPTRLKTERKGSLLDQIVESAVRTDSPHKKRKLKQTKVHSQCMQRLTKDTDENSIQYLRKYGLQETINLNDDISKFRLTAAATTARSLKSQQNKDSFEQHDEQFQKQQSLQSSPRNDPYQLKNGNQFMRFNLSVGNYNLQGLENKELAKQNQNIKDQPSITNNFTVTAPPSNQRKFNTKSEHKFWQLSVSPTKEYINSQEKGVQSLQVKSLLSSMTNLKSEQEMQPITSNLSLNTLLTPLIKSNQDKQLQLNTEECYRENKQLQQQSNAIKNKINPFSIEDREKNCKSSQNLSKSQQRVQEKQKNMKQSLQLKEDFINFYDNVIITSNQQAKSSNRINRQIKRMVSKTDKSLASIQNSEGPKLSTLSHEFRDFKEMKIFKRKFFNFAVNKIHPDDRKSLFELYSMTHRKQVEEIFAQQMKK